MLNGISGRRLFVSYKWSKNMLVLKMLTLWHLYATAQPLRQAHQFVHWTNLQEPETHYMVERLVGQDVTEQELESETIFLRWYFKFHVFQLKFKISRYNSWNLNNKIIYQTGCEKFAKFNEFLVWFRTRSWITHAKNAFQFFLVEKNTVK